MPAWPSDNGLPSRHWRVANELAALDPVRRSILDFAQGHGLTARAVFKLELVLEEVLMNRLLHAFKDGGRHCTDVTVQLPPGGIDLCFEDDGVPFNPMDAPEPVAPSRLEDAVPGGLGLMLTRKVAVACDYERVAARNRFTARLSIL